MEHAQQSSEAGPGTERLADRAVAFARRAARRPWPTALWGAGLKQTYDPIEQRRPVPRRNEPIWCKHPVNPSCQLGGAGRPAMREQFGDVGRLVGRQSREDVFQIGVGIVPVELGRLDQAHDGSRALTGAQ